MTRDRLYLFDTTLRDGQQTQGVQFSTAEKAQIARALDALGVDYIEGGWPGANPTDSEFFASPPETKATLTAFGMTRRVGRSAENDDVLAAVLNAGTPAVCLVGKTHEFHVATALNVTLDENREAIASSIRHLLAKGREALFDAEHFFDGYKANPDYTLECLHAAHNAGARWIVLCDTNGGTLPQEVYRITRAVIASGIPGEHIAIHTHDDTGNAVANSLAAVDAGARQVQGTLNGLGERCGNAPLEEVVLGLHLCQGMATGIDLAGFPAISQRVAVASGRPLCWQKSVVGEGAFTHEAGIHVDGLLKDPDNYQGFDPGLVGRRHRVVLGKHSGARAVQQVMAGLGHELSDTSARTFLQRLRSFVAEKKHSPSAADLLKLLGS